MARLTFDAFVTDKSRSPVIAPPPSSPLVLARRAPSRLHLSPFHLLPRPRLRARLDTILMFHRLRRCLRLYRFVMESRLFA